MSNREQSRKLGAASPSKRVRDTRVVEPAYGFSAHPACALSRPRRSTARNLQRERFGKLWWGRAMKATKPTPMPHLLSIATVAVVLGVSGKTVRRMVRDRQLPSHRVGRQIRISQADLGAFLVRSRSV